MKKRILGVAISSALIFGCGGDSGGSEIDSVSLAGNDGVVSSDVVENDVVFPVDADYSINGHVIDGYLVNAKVFIDLNSNGVLDQNEPFTVTDYDGSYNLGLSEAQAERVAGRTVIAIIDETTVDVGITAPADRETFELGLEQGDYRKILNDAQSGLEVQMNLAPLAVDQLDSLMSDGYIFGVSVTPFTDEVYQTLKSDIETTQRMIDSGMEESVLRNALQSQEEALEVEKLNIALIVASEAGIDLDLLGYSEEEWTYFISGNYLAFSLGDAVESVEGVASDVLNDRVTAVDDGRDVEQLPTEIVEVMSEASSCSFFDAVLSEVVECVTEVNAIKKTDLSSGRVEISSVTTSTIIGDSPVLIEESKQLYITNADGTSTSEQDLTEDLDKDGQMDNFTRVYSVAVERVTESSTEHEITLYTDAYNLLMGNYSEYAYNSFPEFIEAVESDEMSERVGVYFERTTNTYTDIATVEVFVKGSLDPISGEYLDYFKSEGTRYVGSNDWLEVEETDSDGDGHFELVEKVGNFDGDYYSYSESVEFDLQHNVNYWAVSETRDNGLFPISVNSKSLVDDNNMPIRVDGQLQTYFMSENRIMQALGDGWYDSWQYREFEVDPLYSDIVTVPAAYQTFSWDPNTYGDGNWVFTETSETSDLKIDSIADFVIPKIEDGWTYEEIQAAVDIELQ